MRKTLRWGVIGTGAIAAAFVEALRQSDRCQVVNLVGSSPEKSRAFATRWEIPGFSGSLPELLGDATVEAVYVATPHPAHQAHALACIAAGKAVLCEKPLATQASAAVEMIEAARQRGVFLMEAFMYRCHPLMQALLVRLQDGTIGPLRHVRADFGFRVERNPAGRLFDLALGGGAILDIGGYPVSFARLVAGVAEGKPFAEPTALAASGFLGPTGADELASAHLTFASGMGAQVTCAIRHDVGTSAVVFGEAGKIVLPDPWVPGSERNGLESWFTVFRDGREPERVVTTTDRSTYAIEAELVADTLPEVEAAWPAMSWADTVGNMRVLDAWQAALRSSPNASG